MKMKVNAKNLNVRIGPGVEYTILRQLSKNEIVETGMIKNDWIWIKDFGWVNKSYLTNLTESITEVKIKPPINTYRDIVSIFGEPCSPQCSSGRIILPAPIKIGWHPSYATKIACHEFMVTVFTNVFNEIYNNNLWSLIRTFDGIYECRSIKNSNILSYHSFGIAIDLNASTNRMGTKGDMPLEIVNIFKSHGFFWGGLFQGLRIDPMHFEFVRRD